MLRISKNTPNISSIKWFTKQEVDPGYQGNDIDSFVLVPGVTNYRHIYSSGKWIVFDSDNSYIGVEFLSESDLERFFIQLMRDIKLNQITNVNIDTKTN
jgi:hypothetical protein